MSTWSLTRMLTAFTGLCLLGGLSISPARGEQNVVPPFREQNCVTTWRVTCGNETTYSEDTGIFGSAEESESAAYDAANDWAIHNCGSEDPYSIDLMTQCEESPKDDSKALVGRAPTQWKVKYSCVGCTGRPLSITRSGNTFCDAYQAAKKAVCTMIQKPVFGGCRRCSQQYCVVERPSACCCCCRQR